MHILVQSLAPALIAFAAFGLIIMGRRLWNGDPPLQPADRAKMGLVFSHVLPLLVACLAYNVVVHARLGLWIELLTVAAVIGTLMVTVFRYLKAVDLPLTRSSVHN